MNNTHSHKFLTSKQTACGMNRAALHLYLPHSIFREEVDSAEAGFHEGPLSWLNLNLEC